MFRKPLCCCFWGKVKRKTEIKNEWPEKEPVITEIWCHAVLKISHILLKMDHNRTLFGTTIFFSISNLMTYIARFLPGGTFSTISFWFLKKQPPGTAPKKNCSETLSKLKKTHAKEFFFNNDADLHPARLSK